MLAKIGTDCKTCVARKKTVIRVCGGFCGLAHEGNTAYPLCGVRAGPPAAATRETRQAREGAAVAVMPGAGVWLARILLFYWLF